MTLATCISHVRACARAIWHLPDTVDRLTGVEEFALALGDDLDQFDKRIDDALALAQEGHRGGEPADLLPDDPRRG